jgi:hypothetical protein
MNSKSDKNDDFTLMLAFFAFASACAPNPVIQDDTARDILRLQEDVANLRLTVEQILNDIGTIIDILASRGMLLAERKEVRKPVKPQEKSS